MKTLLSDASTVTGWQSPNRCDNSGPNCLEVAEYGDGVAVRNSVDPTGPALLFTTAELRAFVLSARAGQYDNLI
jgi:hypothetical protein